MLEKSYKENIIFINYNSVFGKYKLKNLKPLTFNTIFIYFLNNF